MRQLTDHIVERDAANHQLKISVLDEPGQGGANHEYLVDWKDGMRFRPDSPNEQASCATAINFQNGPIQEVGVNGLTHEALTAILIDRLRSFQAGPFAGRENAIALTHYEEALMWLQKRTRARMARGVEGTHQK
jgi:hypothetical protein